MHRRSHKAVNNTDTITDCSIEIHMELKYPFNCRDKNRNMKADYYPCGQFQPAPVSSYIPALLLMDNTVLTDQGRWQRLYQDIGPPILSL